MRRAGVVLAATAAALVLSAPPIRCSESGIYEESLERVNALAKSRSVRVLRPGKSHEGRTIPAFVISDFAIPPDAKARVLICSGQHGDEPNPVRSVVSLCESLACGKKRDVLQSCAVVVVPMVNPDGLVNGERLNSRGQDINRDWPTLATREASYVDSIISQWKPHLLIDAHEWDEPCPLPGDSIEVPACSSDSRHRAMAALADLVQENSGAAKILCGTHCDRRLFHRHYSANGYAAYLLETAWDKDMKTKNQLYTSAITTLLDSISDNHSVLAQISPAASSFDISQVSAYLKPRPSPVIRAAMPVVSAGLLSMMAIFSVLVFVVKPSRRGGVRCPARGIHPAALLSHPHTDRG